MYTLNAKILKAKRFKSLGARKQNGLSGIATMDYGHLCQSENTLSFTCTAQKDTRLTLLTNYNARYRKT